MLIARIMKTDESSLSPEGFHHIAFQQVVYFPRMRAIKTIFIR